MSLFETYMKNVENVKRANPGAEIVNVTRSAGSILAPSWEMLNLYKSGRINWDRYIERFVREMENPKSKAEMLRIAELSKKKDVFLVCFERVGNCHRFLLVDMIRKLMLDNTCRQVNQLVTERPDLVKASYDNIAKTLRVEV
jgi:hypothetical protein